MSSTEEYTLSYTFKLPFTVNSKQYYFVYSIEGKKFLDVRSEAFHLYIVITDKDGNTYKEDARTYPLFSVSSSQGLFSHHDIVVMKEKLFSYLRKQIKHFIDFPPNAKVKNIKDIPTAVSALPFISEVFEFCGIKKDEAILFDLSLLTVQDFLLKKKDYPFISDLGIHAKFLRNLYDGLTHLSYTDLENLKKFKLKKERIVSNKLWSDEYKDYLLGLLIEAYERATGKYFIPLACLDGTSDEVDKKMLLYVSRIFEESSTERITLRVRRYYNEKRGIRYKDILKEYNNKQRSKINGEYIGYFTGFYGYEDSRVIRVIHQDNIQLKYRDENYYEVWDYNTKAFIKNSFRKQKVLVLRKDVLFPDSLEVDRQI